MGNIAPEDARQLAEELGITRDSVTGSEPLDATCQRCNCCGACCRTQNGVIISLNDAYLLSRRLRIPMKNFVRKYCREASAYDIFGRGPFKGLAIKTKKGICPFYSDQDGCTVNDVKPMVCRLYPFNTIHITRASILKMQRKKDGDCYDGCFIYSLDNAGLIEPDFNALAAYSIQMEVTREYFRLADERWDDDRAQNAIGTGTRLSADDKSLEVYAKQLRLAFDGFDQRNESILLGILSGNSSQCDELKNEN